MSRRIMCTYEYFYAHMKLNNKIIGCILLSHSAVFHSSANNVSCVRHIQHEKFLDVKTRDLDEHLCDKCTLKFYVFIKLSIGFAFVFFNQFPDIRNIINNYIVLYIWDFTKKYLIRGQKLVNLSFALILL